MREWLTSLTRPEDHLLWAWVAIVAGYAVVGATLGLRARRRASPRGQPTASLAHAERSRAGLARPAAFG